MGNYEMMQRTVQSLEAQIRAAQSECEASSERMVLTEKELGLTYANFTWREICLPLFLGGNTSSRKLATRLEGELAESRKTLTSAIDKSVSLQTQLRDTLTSHLSLTKDTPYLFLNTLVEETSDAKKAADSYFVIVDTVMAQKAESTVGSMISEELIDAINYFRLVQDFGTAAIRRPMSVARYATPKFRDKLNDYSLFLDGAFENFLEVKLPFTIQSKLGFVQKPEYVEFSTPLSLLKPAGQDFDNSKLLSDLKQQAETHQDTLDRHSLTANNALGTYLEMALEKYR